MNGPPEECETAVGRYAGMPVNELLLRGGRQVRVDAARGLADGRLRLETARRVRDSECDLEPTRGAAESGPVPVAADAQPPTTGTSDHGRRTAVRPEDVRPQPPRGEFGDAVVLAGRYEDAGRIRQPPIHDDLRVRRSRSRCSARSGCRAGRRP